MKDFSYNKYESGLALLNIIPIKKADAEDWLNLEVELRKLSIPLLKKDKLNLAISKKRLQKLQKLIIWPDNFHNSLAELITSLSEEIKSLPLIFEILKTILNEYFQSLPNPGYWDYEELIKRLERILNYVREKDFKIRFQKILNLVDNHQWSVELRHKLEDLLEINHSNELYQNISNIIKKLKHAMPVPVF